MNRRTILALLICLLLGTSCSTGQPQQRTLTVLAAASLTESFNELAQRFTADHPDVQVRFDYQGSSTLAEQIRQGRQADVFASADRASMDRVGDLVTDPQVFATNRLVIAVPSGNPAGIRSAADLAAPGNTVVVCAPPVPCGAATREVLRASGVQLRPASEENDVKAVLNKVAAGEADAGLVYTTDARAAAGEVEAIELPHADQAINSYPVGVLRDAAEPELARQFVDFLRGPAGREVLAEHGFGLP